MSRPFFDLDLVSAALVPLRSDGDVALIQVIGSGGRVDPASALRQTPALLVFSERDEVDNGAGLGIGRQVTTTIGIAIQVRHTLSDDASATNSIQSLRESVFSALDGARLDSQWAPLIWLGGEVAGIDGTTYTHVDRYQTEAPVQ